VVADLSQLQHEKTVLEREHGSIIAAIHELRARARQKSLEASSTRQPLDQTEIDFWKAGIAKHQTELMAVQSKLASVNRAIREVQADQPAKGSRGRDRSTQENNNNDGENVFPSCFFTICRDSLDPRILSALERGARALAEDHRRMHGEAGREALR
jgi:hypothetical protein